MSSDPPTEALHPRTTTLTLDDAAREAVRAIAETSIASLFTRHSGEVADEVLEALWDSEEALAASVVRYILRTAEAPAADELSLRTREHRDRLGALGPRAAIQLSTAVPTFGGESFLATAALRIAALEVCHDAALVTERGLALVVRELPAHMASAALEQRVLSRVLWEVGDDGPVDLELDAAHWYFERWSAPFRVGEQRWRRAYLRGQEWMLVDRVSAVLGVPAMAHLLDRRVHRAWPARQRRMAEMFPGSSTGIFELCEIGGPGAGRLVSAVDGRAYDCVYDPASEPRRGFLLVGRLLPLGDGRWVPAMSTEGAEPNGPGDMERAVRLFDELRRELPDALALEGAISRHVHRMAVPRSVPPAHDPDDAARRLHALHSLPRAWGVDRVAERLTAEERGRLLEMEAGSGAGDRALSEWTAALLDLARKRIPTRRLEQRRRKRKAKKGRRR